MLAHGAPAYRLAVRLLGSVEEAEDAVQQAYLDVIAQARAGGRAPTDRAWFLRVVANNAKDRLRSEISRKRREQVTEPHKPETPSAVASGTDALSFLRGAMEVLDPKYRVPLALCYEEELSQREAAAVLDISESAVSKHVNTGLATLRKAMERAGYPAAVAAAVPGVASAKTGATLIEMLKQTAPVVPATLAGRIEALAARGTAGAAGDAASTAAGGGLGMKLIAGIVLAGVAAAGVMAISGVGGGGALPAAAAKKFSTPIWLIWSCCISTCL